MCCLAGPDVLQGRGREGDERDRWRVEQPEKERWIQFVAGAKAGADVYGGASDAAEAAAHVIPGEKAIQGVALRGDERRANAGQPEEAAKIVTA